MTDNPQSHSRIKRFGIFLTLALLTLAVLYVCVDYPTSPEGVYYAPDLAGKYAYWTFKKDGQVYLQTEGIYNFAGRYLKSENEWIAYEGTNKFGRIVFKPTLLGMTVCYNSQLKKRHVFLFRKSFSWVADCEEWFKKNF